MLITLEYHVRSAELLADRYDAELRGPADMAPRLEHPERLVAWAEGEPGPAGALPFAVDGEWPLWFPTHAAAVFGDVVVRNPAGELRIWEQEAPGAARQAELTRALTPLAALEADHVLTTHGAPVVGGGAAALRAAVAAPPWEFAD